MAVNETVGSDAYSETSSAYDRIKRDILRGELPPATRLVETALASRYGLSRTPIREALRALEHDGWVSRGSRGLLQVRGTSVVDILDLFETRLLLESAAARIGTDRRTEQDVMTVQHLLDHMGEHDPTNEGRVEANRRFHRAMWEACHNGVLASTLDSLYDRSTTFLSSTLTSEERWDMNMRDHVEMVDALVARDSDRAEALVRLHLARARDFRLADLKPQIS